MRVHFILFFCLCCSFCYSQKVKTNQRDSFGVKQGYWIEYDSLTVEGYIVSAQILKDSLGRTDRTFNVDTKFDLIKHVGYYENGNKNGNWKIFHSKVLWIKVAYDKGQRVKIEVLFPNGKPLYTAEKVDNKQFIVKEYSKKGMPLKELYKTAEVINNIEEMKLFTIGF